MMPGMTQGLDQPENPAFFKSGTGRFFTGGLACSRFAFMVVEARA